MRPVLVALPSKVLFALALILAVATFVQDRRKRRKDPKLPKNATPLWLLAGAWALVRFRAYAWLPTPDVFAKAWDAVPIHSYGVMLGTAMIIGWFLAMRLAKQDGIPAETAGNIYMWTAVWSIVGARLLYGVTMPSQTLQNPLGIFKIWEGGLVAYGGMIGGFLASWYNCRKAGIPLLRWADVSAPAVVLGTAITRVGCLLYGCDYGRPTSVAWAIQFPKGSPAFNDQLKDLKLPQGATASLPVHPTQLYEMAAGLFLFGLLMYLRRVRKFSGMPFLGWVIGYGILRSIIEIYRDDQDRGFVFGTVSTSMFIGMVSTVLGVALLIALLKRYRQDPASLRLWELPLQVPAPAAAGGGGGGHKRRRAR
jgi:phosphatidylglycerol:prolipoprotein diacylglycerol transferase